MLVSVTNDYEQLSRCAARLVAEAVRKKADLRLGLPTGRTPLGMYRELVRMRQDEHLDFSRVVCFNLDEYADLPPAHPKSFRQYMRENFFRSVNVRPQNIHIPDGSAADRHEEVSRRYEEAIRKAGGIDLLISGIGVNGHIAFNEPASSLSSRTRLVTLAPATRIGQRSSFTDGDAPARAITMGIGTILEARKIVLLASGPEKAAAVRASIEGPVTEAMPASALQRHPDALALLDVEAAAELSRSDLSLRHT